MKTAWTLGLLALAAPAAADDWSSLGEAIFLGYVFLAAAALQLLACAVLAVLRARQRGWKSGLAYFGGALAVPVVSVLLLSLLAKAPMPLDPGISALAVAFVLAPLGFTWLAFALMVREHDRQEENRVWKQTR